MIVRLLIIISLLFSTNSQTNENWYRGNTHTHTTNSDGDSKSEDVVEWYHSHGYNFLVITDHNKLIDPESIEIMAPKAIFRVIKLENIVLQDTIIIKQDMLSLGGEAAIPKDAFKLKQHSADILIMGTLQQLHELVGKLNRHYPRLKNIAKELAVLLKDVK